MWCALCSLCGVACVVCPSVGEGTHSHPSSHVVHLCNSQGDYSIVHGVKVFICSFSNDFATVLDGLINQGFAELHKGLCDVYHSAAQA